MYQIINNYRDNEVLRTSFNELAKETFELNFEDWYQNGFWGDTYNPYSIVADNKIIANVSVNKTDMLLHGKIKHFLQLGTVMTKTSYRNQGFIRLIMERIDADYAGKTDGIYLFANDSVLDFYPKFGFEQAREFQYTKKVLNPSESLLEKVVMDNPAAWKRLTNAMENTVFHGSLDMLHNSGLIMFYVTKFMKECVFYHKASDTYIIAEQEDKSLLIHNVFSKTVTELDTVIEWFGNSINKVTLGFVPADTKNWQQTEYHEADCTFFIKGADMKIMETERLRIPSLSHA